MNLINHYRNLYNSSIEKIINKNVELDEQIDSSADLRYGITLLLRPDQNIIKNFQKFINEAKLIEPEQYYYPSSDIHVTVMSIISCYNGFKLEDIVIEDYASIISECINRFEGFRIKFSGLTASANCIMVQGFPNNSNLNNIRDNLRREFKNSKLEQSLDKRYLIQTAHSTLVRFRKPLKKKKEFLQLLDNYLMCDFGSSTIDKLELVANDWYQRNEKVKILTEFNLKNTLTP